MKKAFLSAALALAVAGSWAFYPKAPAEPSGYMMVIGRISGSAFSADASLIVITADGKTTEQQIPARSFQGKSLNVLCTAELSKLNQLKSEGWEITQKTNAYSAVLYENTYLLKKL